MRYRVVELPGAAILERVEDGVRVLILDTKDVWALGPGELWPIGGSRDNEPDEEGPETGSGTVVYASLGTKLIWHDLASIHEVCGKKKRWEWKAMGMQEGS